MGTEQVLRAAGALTVVVAATAHAAPAKLHERVAVIDLGPDAASGAARQKLQEAIVAAGLDAVIGDGVDDALAGIALDPDAVQLAAALAEAKRAFGALDCKTANASAQRAIELGAARQASGLPAPELAQAWSYTLECADRAGDADAAFVAASRLRALDQPDDAVMARYPEIDAVPDRDIVQLDVAAEVAGADVWIDHRRVGTSPLHVALPTGRHVIAAGKGERRGVVVGTVVAAQPTIAIAMPKLAAAHAALAKRVASWNGKVPAAAELAWVLDRAHARLALVRHGETVEVWGRVGKSEAPHQLGGADGVRTLAEADRAVALVVDRVHGWNDHAPDPDRPLLVETPAERAKRDTAHRNPPTKWWVYAAIAGAAAIGLAIVYAHDTASDTQHVELKYP